MDESEKQGHKHWDEIVADDLEGKLLSKVVAFLKTFEPPGGDPRWSAEHFKWKLEQNPAGRGYLSCAVANDMVVGTASITPKRIWYRNKVVLGGEAGDIYTHPEHRKPRSKGKKVLENNTVSEKVSNYTHKSIFGKLATQNTVRALKRDVNVIYGVPNAAASPGWKRMGYRVHSMHLLNLYRPSILSVFNRWKLAEFSKKSFFRPLISILSTFESLLEAVSFKFWQSKEKRMGYSIERKSEATSDLADLWERVKFQREFSLVRDQRYFQHRFVENPLAKYEFYMVSHKGKLCGVIVLRVHLTGGGLNACTIADWLYDESKEHLFPVMLAHVIHDQYSKGIRNFKSWCGERRKAKTFFHKLGFISTGYSPIILYPNDLGREILATCPSLDFTIASSDNI